MEKRVIFDMRSKFWQILSAVIGALLAVAVLSLLARAQVASARAPFDVTDYKITADVLPDNNSIKAVTDVTFVPGQDTRSVAFEFNGSLKIESIVRVAGPAPVAAVPVTAASPLKGASRPRPTPKSAMPEVTFVQDQVGVGELGYSVRVDLGEVVTAGTPVTLRFKYAGVLVTPEGGPLNTKRLAAVDRNSGYLFYAARWFPFHDYAADRATSDITLNLPAGWVAAGYSDLPPSAMGRSFRFVQSKPGLIGNIAYGKYAVKTLRYADYEMNFYTKPGAETQIPVFGETIGKALDFYTKQYGRPDGGTRLTVVQIDDESLDYYSGPGAIFLSDGVFTRPNPNTEARLQREVAYQWWGQTVGLKSFDDAWLSQGLAEWSSVYLRESQLSGAALDGLYRELLEKALTFEQTVSVARAPATVDDQSVQYQYVMYGKGAMIYRLLRDTLGIQKYNQLMRTFFEQNRGKNVSIDDFEKAASQVAGTNMRYFFARWVEGTGVPEFQVDYQIIRTRAGKFVARGTVKQNYDNLRLPVEVMLRAEGENENKFITLRIEDASEDFSLESNGKPLEVVVDPNYKILRISEELRISAIARRGIEQYKDGKVADAQQQFEAALKLDRSNSWVYYNLGVLFLEQRNYDLAIDNFKAALNGTLRPEWIQAWANIKMGNAYDAKGDRTRAVSAYKRAQTSDIQYDNAQDAVKKYLAAPFDPKVKSTTAIK